MPRRAILSHLHTEFSCYYSFDGAERYFTLSCQYAASLFLEIKWEFQAYTKAVITCSQKPLTGSESAADAAVAWGIIKKTASEPLAFATILQLVSSFRFRMFLKFIFRWILSIKFRILKICGNEPVRMSLYLHYYKYSSRSSEIF